MSIQKAAAVRATIDSGETTGLGRTERALDVIAVLGYAARLGVLTPRVFTGFRPRFQSPNLSPLARNSELQAAVCAGPAVTG